MSRMTRLREYARQYGLWGLLSHLALRVVQPVWQRSSLIVYLHEGPSQPVQPKIELRIAPLGAGMADSVAWAEADWQKRWSRGDVCCAAYVNDACVHTSWVTRVGAPVGEVHQWLELDRNEAYIYDCYTDGSYRGKRIYPAVLSTILRQLSEDGAVRVWIAAEVQNVASARAIRSVGFAEVGSIEYRRLGQSEVIRHHVSPDRPWPQFKPSPSTAE